MSKKPPKVFLWCYSCHAVTLPGGKAWVFVKDGKIYELLKAARGRGEKTLATVCQTCMGRLETGRGRT